MQFKQTVKSQLVYLIILSFSPFISFSQTTYLPEGSREYILLERLEILSQKDSILNFSKLRPFSRKQYIPVIEAYGKSQGSQNPFLSKVDRANITSALAKNNEWSEEQQPSKRTFLNRFYRTPANLYEVKANDFILTVNPIFQYYLGKEQDNDEHIFLNSRGAALRGRIANKIGFAASVIDNQERDPFYVQQYVVAKKAVPGQGFFKQFKKTGYDYFDARGYVTFNATRYIDFQFGYDKNFIGNGYRSLLLSDISSPYLFFKINTRIWRFNYQNLFVELNSAQRLNADQLFPKKYAAIHHLDMGITKWLNIGLFEGVVFGRVNHFEFGYLNPIIFYRSIEQQNGSVDNAVIGFDAKANVAKRFQFYGQLLVDEFNFEEMRRAKGWWGNKYGWQIGAKYINAFQIKNLDLQLESNRVRPFTYSHRDSVANYTHYNQPLAHPLGANFQEWVGIARYQPAAKWLVEAKAFYMYRGKDSGNVSFGGNIFLPNVPPYRKSDYGYNIVSGVESKTGIASLLVSFEVKPNFFIEANSVYRKEGATVVDGAKSTFIFYGGIRWNMHRRDFEF